MIKVPLTHKLLETHECVLCTAATDTLVLKHWGISIEILAKHRFNLTEQRQEIK